jgi:hypothetical protein
MIIDQKAPSTVDRRIPWLVRECHQRGSSRFRNCGTHARNARRAHPVAHLPGLLPRVARQDRRASAQQDVPLRLSPARCAPQRSRAAARSGVFLACVGPLLAVSRLQRDVLPAPCRSSPHGHMGQLRHGCDRFATRARSGAAVADAPHGVDADWSTTFPGVIVRLATLKATLNLPMYARVARGSSLLPRCHLRALHGAV